MAVKIREQILSTGERSLYLDVYHKGRRERIWLGIRLTGDKAHDKEKLRLAEAVRVQKELAVLISRLGRIVDRGRVLREQRKVVEEANKSERKVLTIRAFWVHWSIVFCTVSALLVAVVIAVLFLASEVHFDPTHTVSLSLS